MTNYISWAFYLLGCVKADNFPSLYASLDLLNEFKVVQVDLPGYGESRTFDRTFPGATFFERDADAVIETMQVSNYQ